MSYIVKVIPAPAGTTSENVLYVSTLGGTVVDTNSIQTISLKLLNGVTANNIVITNSTQTGGLISNATVRMVTASLTATGGNIATANAVTSTYPGFVLVTGANGTAGVQLPAASSGMRYVIKNSESAAAVLKVYPQVNCTINEASANASISMAANTCAEFIAHNTSAWYSNPKVPS